jgi:hypothetical protein
MFQIIVINYSIAYKMGEWEEEEKEMRDETEKKDIT